MSCCLEHLKEESNITVTENGAAAYESTMSYCLDLFADIGAIREAADIEILHRFVRAYAENPDIAIKILFYGRDVRGGLGERHVFRVIIKWLADNEPSAVRKNISLIPFYGRYDDLLCLLGTACEDDVVSLIRAQLNADVQSDGEASLLAKWLPSVNTSNGGTVRLAKHLARKLNMTDAQYRKTLSALRRKINIIENNLREKDYSFNYETQPSKALYKYRKAFMESDGDRYTEYLEKVRAGTAKMNTSALTPYEVIVPCVKTAMWGLNTPCSLSAEERSVIDTTWRALPDYTTGENALAVVDGSGSMYSLHRNIMPAAAALSLGIYFAERNTGAFRDHFITFSEKPQLVHIQGGDITEKVRFCASFNEVANTNLQRVFELILDTAVRHKLPQKELPARLYIISDMEFDCCTENADTTNFACAKSLFARHGYTLPEVIFWNVAAHSTQQPVRKNEQGAALVSGCTPRLFSLAAGGALSPFSLMMDIVNSSRYAVLSA